MNCRKCGCEILEDTKFCQMCGAKQRQPKVSHSQNPETMAGGDTRTGLNSVVVAIISALITLSIIGIVVLLFNVIDFDRSEGQPIEVENIDTDTTESDLTEEGSEDIWTEENVRTEPSEEDNRIERPSAVIPTLEFSTNDAFIMNQVGSGWVMTSFVTEDAIYFIEEGDGRVVNRTTDYFATSEVIANLEHWTSSFHVTEDAIYYTVLGDMDWEDDIDWDEVEWIQYLYRYSFSSGESIQVADEIFNEVVVDHLVFHQRESFGGGLYVLDLTTGDRRLLIEEIDGFNFVIDPENDRIIFRSPEFDDRAVYQMSLSGENETRLLEDTFDFVAGNNIIAWQESRTIHFRNLDTNEITTVENDNGFSLWSAAFLGQYLVTTCWDNYLWLIDTTGVDQPQRIVEDVLGFTLLGNYILYIGWDDWESIYITDLNGNSEVFRSFLE